MMDRLAGQAKVQRKTTNQTTGDSIQAFTEPTSKHRSCIQSITETRESVLGCDTVSQSFIQPGCCSAFALWAQHG